MNAADTTPNERRPPRTGIPGPTRPAQGDLARRTIALALSTVWNYYPPTAILAEKGVTPAPACVFLSVSVPTRMPTARSKHVFRYREARSARLPGFQARSPI